MVSAILYGLRLSLFGRRPSATVIGAWRRHHGRHRGGYFGGRITPSDALVDIQLSFPAILTDSFCWRSRQGRRQGGDCARLGAMGLLRAHHSRLKDTAANPLQCG